MNKENTKILSTTLGTKSKNKNYNNRNILFGYVDFCIERGSLFRLVTKLLAIIFMNFGYTYLDIDVVLRFVYLK